MDDERIVRDFLGDRLGAAQLAEWVATLRDRLARLQEDLPRACGDDRTPLEAQVRRLKRQIAALEEEAAITQFVEDSVRVTLAMGAASEGGGEEG
jgi:transposase-like protein